MSFDILLILICHSFFTKHTPNVPEVRLSGIGNVIKYDLVNQCLEIG